PKYQVKTIVIDPGHGGHDSGCLGSSSKEKHIALAVSLKLGELIEKYFPDIRVIYTRKTDVFVELHERAAIANRNKADLFICIHCNSGPSTALGAETFVMGLHKTEDNLSVARRENESALLEKDYQANYEGYDPKSPEAHIIFSLYQNTYMEQSLAFASKLQYEFENYSGRNNRGVKQAGFLVLYRTAMPSVLIELGFLTNANDERFLASNDGQSSMANSILRAFTKYKNDQERKAGGGAKGDSNSNSTGSSTSGSTSSSTSGSTSDALSLSKGSSTTSKGNTASDAKSPNKGITTDSSVQNKTVVTDTVVRQSIVNQSSIVVVDEPVDAGKPKVLYFAIQIGAIPAASATKPNKYSKVEGAYYIDGEDGLRRYFVGRFADNEEAGSNLSNVKKMGFTDAFVCGVFNGKKISAKEAVELSKTK
ncbi:MAG: N-acetylmuramoyl-L-alanine amidase, partial [Bacteroidota bacterium]